MDVRVFTKEELDTLKENYHELVGRGGYGCVYAVMYEEMLCALKTSLSDENDYVFLNEMEQLLRIGGAGGSPRLLGFCLDEKTFLMTFCGSENLCDYVCRKSQELYLEDVLTLALRVTERLQEVHQLGIIHNDLKSDNVNVTLNAQ